MYIPSDLQERRKPLKVAGNPHGFYKLIDGKQIIIQFWEPDANTARLPYWYDARNNKLYKQHKVINHLTGVESYVWKPVINTFK
jgi:hypothetical protein